MSDGETAATRPARDLTVLAGRALLGLTGVAAIAAAVAALGDLGVTVGTAALAAALGVSGVGCVALAATTGAGGRASVRAPLLLVDIVIGGGLSLAGHGSLLVRVLVVLAVVTALVISIRDEDRMRGSGWLDCPSCHEHALQDVVDRMRFVRFFGYRLGVLGLRRFLICRRCGFRRRLTDAERRTLDTSGTRIRPGNPVPVGLVGLLIAGSIVYFGFIATPAVAGPAGITFNRESLQEVIGAPLQYDEPNGWNREALDYDPRPELGNPGAFLGDPREKGLKYADINIRTSTGRTDIKIFRIPGETSLTSLALTHFQEEKNLQATEYPTVLPAASCTTVAGAKAATFSLEYAENNDPSKAIFYVFVHEKVGYVVEFSASQRGAVADLPALADHVIGSMSFTGTEPPPSGTPSATATATPKPTPVPGVPTPKASPTPQPISC
jgi:hypothetical protein